MWNICPKGRSTIFYKKLKGMAQSDISDRPLVESVVVPLYRFFECFDSGMFESVSTSLISCALGSKRRAALVGVGALLGKQG